MEPPRARKIATSAVVPVPIGADDLLAALGRAAESTRVHRDQAGMLDLLALRIITKVHTPTLVEIRQLKDAGYRGWIRGDERRLLRGQPLGDGWGLVDVATFGEETWQVERDGALLPGEYCKRPHAIAYAWADAAQLGRVVGPQMLAVMMRPPKDYAVVLVAGVSEFSSRLGSSSEVPR
jgi:hypothetical protein